MGNFAAKSGCMIGDSLTLNFSKEPSLVGNSIITKDGFDDSPLTGAFATLSFSASMSSLK